MLFRKNKMPSNFEIETLPQKELPNFPKKKKQKIKLIEILY